MSTKYTDAIRETTKRYQEKMTHGSYGWTLAGAATEEADIIDALLPEALALLKRIHAAHERMENTYPLDAEAEDILRRAGVLK